MKKNLFDVILGNIYQGTLYCIMPPIALYVGYRVYWRENKIYSLEHQFVAVS